jgi:hypothetical protein
VDHLHECVFCGWSRESASATILAPRCEACGCLLRSGPRTRLTPPSRPAEPMSRPLRLVFAVVAVAFLAGALYAAVRVGYDAGGPWLALTAAAAVAYAALPLVPQQL